MKKWTYLTIVSILAATTAVSFAQPKGKQQGRPGRGCPGGGHKGAVGIQWIQSHAKLAEKIGITDEDIAKLTDIEYEQKKTMIPLHSKQRLAQVELDYLLEQDTPDQDAVNKIIDELGAIQTEIKKTEINGYFQVKTALGAEKFEKLQEARRNYFKNRRNKNKKDRQGRNKGSRKNAGRKGFGSGQGGPGVTEIVPPVEDEVTQ